MKRALIIGSSGGIGGAMMRVLPQHGIAPFGLSRQADGLDVTDESLVAGAMRDMPGPFDLIFVATGALVIGGARPEKTLRAVTAEALMNQYAVNAVGPMLVLKHALPLIANDKPAVFAALSARVGSIGDNRLGGWHSYRAAKAGLNQLLHGASIELARTHKQLCVAALHPGTVETPFTADYAARHATVPPEVAAQRLLTVMRGLTPKHTGRFWDYAGREIPW